MDILERDNHALVRRYIDARDSSHVQSLPAAAVARAGHDIRPCGKPLSIGCFVT